MQDGDIARRDAALLRFEAPAGEASLALRAMRGALAPIECADAVVDPALASMGPGPVTTRSGQVLLGLSLAAKLARTAESPPAMKEAPDKERVKRFIQGPLRSWMLEQATAIDALASAGAALEGLGRGIAAVEAGIADLRLVDRIRSAPTPAGWDAELRAAYEEALDEALEPRKRRGRDAALVGLQDFAAAGIVHDARVDRARTLLSKLYGGRRIDALDGLITPPAPAPTPDLVLALVPAPPDARAWFVAGGLAPPAGPRSAKRRLEMGQRYWRRVDFVESAHAAAAAAAAAAKPERDESRLVLALALALAQGPASAKDMMSAPSPAALELGHTEALDALAAEGGSFAGAAAYDAALLRSLAPPEGDASAYLGDVAARFREAAALLSGADKQRAEDRASDAEAAARAPRKPASP